MIEADGPLVRDAKQLVRTRASELLAQGVEAQNQAEVGSALQVFFNLGELREVASQQVTQQLAALDRAAAAALDPKKVNSGAGGNPNAGFLQGRANSGRRRVGQGAAWERPLLAWHALPCLSLQVCLAAPAGYQRSARAAPWEMPCLAAWRRWPSSCTGLPCRSGTCTES